MKTRFNKGVALALSASLVLGLTPSLPGIGVSAYAGDETLDEPSMETYATQQQLMEDFVPSKTDAVIGKLIFGAKGTEWYILGRDGNIGGSTKNIAIFAAEAITTTIFDSHTGDSTRSYIGDEDETYVTTSTLVVYPDHYGESEIRDALRKMSGQQEDETGEYSDFFTSVEKGMMQETTVLTQEQNQPEKLYTTSDRLYLASGRGIGSSYKSIYVGNMSTPETGDIDATYQYTGIALQAATFWSSGERFWLRTPCPYDNVHSLVQFALNANPKFGYVTGYTNSGESTGKVSRDKYDIRPASNLNLTGVLFASAATARTTGDAVGKRIEEGTAMTLRLDGESQNFGKIECTSDTIKVQANTSDVSLVVQGNNGEKDWYYSKPITGTEEVAVSTIADTAGVDAATIDLTSENCKVWIETPVKDDDGNASNTLAYAINKSTHIHEFGDYQANETDHWKECTNLPCPNDDKGKSETLEAHSYGDEDTWYYDSEYHYKKCTVCELDESIKEGTREAHTLDADGKCEVCDYNMYDKHNFEPVPAKEPSCTATGNREYWECTDDGCDVKYYIVLGLPIQFTVKSEGNVLIQATEHTLGDYSYDSSSHWQECSVCHEKVNKAAHTFNGSKCNACGYTKSSNNGNSGDGGDGSTRNSDRYSGSSSRSSSGGSGVTYLAGSAGTSTGWSKDTSGRWWYYDANYGKMIGWVYDKSVDKWYYVDESRGRLYGWFYDTEASYWYYLDLSTGEMLTGWQLIGGKQYYFAPKPPRTTYSFDTSGVYWHYDNPSGHRPYGSMYANTVTPDNHQVDTEGAKIQ